MKQMRLPAGLRGLLLLPILWLGMPESGSGCDLRLAELASPGSTVEVDQPVPVQFVVENIGVDPSVKGEAIVGISRILPNGELTQVYSRVVPISVPENGRAEITLPDWTPTEVGNYRIDIYLFASNEQDFDNNRTEVDFRVEGRPRGCEATAPSRSMMRGNRSVPPLTIIGITQSEELTVSFGTEKPCCWNLNFTQKRLQGRGSLISDSPPSQQASDGSPATFRFRFSHTEPVTELSGFRLEFTWNRCDSPEIGGSEAVTILFLPEPGKGSERQRTTAAAPASGKSGDPVNTATGELFLPWTTDLAFGGPAPFSFRRYYASNLSSLLPPTDILGLNWSHNYAWSVKQLDDLAIVTMPSGRLVTFELQGEEWRTRDRYETTYQLIRTDEGWVFGNSRQPFIRRFDTTGRLQSIVDRRGNRRMLQYREERLESVSDGLGRMLTFNYNEDGKLAGASDGIRTVRYDYEGEELTEITDPRGNRIAVTYDPSRSGLMTGMTRPEGNRPYSQTFDPNARVATQSDAMGNTWNFAYEPEETVITDPEGETVRHDHSSAQELRELTDGKGKAFGVEYDENGRRTKVTDRLGAVTTITYHAPSGNIASITGADGSTTTYGWTERTVEGLRFYDLTTIDYPDGTRKRAEYDSGGNPTAYIDGDGNRWSYTYNVRGQITSATTPEGETTLWFHDPAGRIDSIVDPNGKRTGFEHDALDRLLRITFPDGSAANYEYDGNNNVTAFTDASGGTTRYDYDRNNRRIRTTDRSGGISTIDYDALDRPALLTDPEGIRTRILYNRSGRIAGLVNGGEDTVRFEYDRAGHLSGIVDAGGNRLGRETDDEGVTAAFVDQLGNRWSAETDEMGRIVRAIDPLGAAGEVRYDELGRIQTVVDATGREENFTYDGRGLQTGRDYPGEISVSYSRTPSGYINGLADPLGNDWTFERDEKNRLAGEEDPLGNRTEYEYDDLDRLARIEMPGSLGSVEFRRNARGLAESILYSDGTQTDFTYDADGRTIAGTHLSLHYDKAGRIDTTNGLAVERDDVGRIAAVVLAPGKVLSYRYDDRGFPVKITDWIGGTTTFDYDAAGRLRSITRPNDLKTTFDYDAAGRLTRIEEGTSTRITLTLDPLGRTTSAERIGYLRPTLQNDSSIHTYDEASQVVGFNYDPLGRLTREEKRTCLWNAASQLEELAEEGEVRTWRYDALGNVVERETGGERTEHLWNYALGLPGISVDRNENGTDRRYYVHTPSGFLLYTIDAETGDRHFHHYDEVGTTLLLSDDAGRITDRYAFTPYGRPAGHEGTAENRYTFIGGRGIEQESPSGLYRMRARLYDASTARFISRDPARLLHPKQVNPYRYAMGNPLQYVDVTGREESEVGKQLSEIRNENGGGGLFFLAKILYGLSTRPGEKSAGQTLEEEPIGGEFEFDEEDPIELGDGEHVFGGGEIAQVLLPLAARKPQKPEPVSDVLFDPSDRPDRSGGPLSIPELGRIARETAEMDAIVKGAMQYLPPEPSPQSPFQPRLFVLQQPPAAEMQRPERPVSRRRAPVKMIPGPFGFPIPAGEITPPPLTLDDPDEESEFVEEDPIELGDGEEIL